MKSKSQSSFFTCVSSALLLCSILLSMTGCADTKWPTWITGEPGESVLNNPERVVGSPPVAPKDKWPNLGDMPDKPQNFVPKKEWDSVEEQLNSDKIDADIAKSRMGATAPTFEPPPEP
jgi:hypothetical protein